MARKLIRETKFSQLIRSATKGEYDVIRCETKLEDGFSDILAIQRSTGLPCFIELKQIDHFTNTGYTRIDLAPEQAIFLWERVRAVPHIGACVMLRVGERDIYTFPAREESTWPRWVRSQLYPDQIALPLCFKHSASQLSVAMEKAFTARFTPAPLLPQPHLVTT